MCERHPRGAGIRVPRPISPTTGTRKHRRLRRADLCGHIRTLNQRITAVLGGRASPPAPVTASAESTRNADSGRAALAEGCFLGTAGLVLRRQTCPRVRARAGRRIAGAICGRDGAAARPVLVRAGHAVGDVDPLRRDAERGEGVTLWVRFLFITGDAGASEFEHRHRRGCRLASRHRDCSPNQSYGTRCPGRPRDWPLVKDGVGRGSPHETPAGTVLTPDVDLFVMNPPFTAAESLRWTLPVQPGGANQTSTTCSRWGQNR